MKTCQLALLGVTLLAACDSPTTPDPGDSDNEFLATMEGPQNVAPGETAEYRAVLVSAVTGVVRRDVTAEAEWSVSEEIASIERPGLVRTRTRGEALLSYKYGSRVVHKEVMVIPPGTYRVRGTVFEADSRLGIDGALLEVTSGAGAGLSTVTRFGQYALYGVGGDTAFRVTRAGYHVASLESTVTQHTEINFGMALVAPRLDLSGTYRLTIEAASECGVGLGAGHLPADARTRTYDATAGQNGPFVTFTLKGANFLSGLDFFHASVLPDGIRVTVVVPDNSGGDGEFITEQLLSSEFFAFRGIAGLVGTGRGFAGPLSGRLAVFDRDPRTSVSPKASCESERHQFVLSR